MRQLFIIGCQRCGTTNLYGYLDQHPLIELAKPLRPEPKFFLQKDISFINRYSYENKYFSNIDDQFMYIGEKSTSYIESKYALGNLNSVYPEAKYIVILREPIRRMISNYRFSFQNNLEKFSFDEAIKMENYRESDKNLSVSPFSYKKRSIYINYLRSIYEILDFRQVKVIILEQLISSPQILKELWQWLNLDPINVVEDSNFRNDTNINLSIDSNMIPSLVKEFTKYNSELEDLLQIDLSIWKKESWYDFD